jgi:hypothetical protein
MKFRNEVLPFCRQISFPYLSSGFILNNAKLGKKIPIPLPVVRTDVYAPDRYIRALLRYRQLGCSRLSPDLGRQDWVFVPPMHLTMTFHFLEVLASEWEVWKKHYAPPSEGLTILDAGASCGETAWLFLNHFWAKKVICLEPDPEAFEILRRNKEANHWNVEIRNERFHPAHLRGVDFAKIDIESGEEEFANLAYPPTVMETHTKRITRLFTENPRHSPPFRIVWNNHRGMYLIRNC